MFVEKENRFQFISSAFLPGNFICNEPRDNASSMFKGGQRDFFLTFEVAVNTSLRQAGSSHDVLHGGAGISFLVEKGSGALNDVLTGTFCFA